jgi:hypothetical protein
MPLKKIAGYVISFLLGFLLGSSQRNFHNQDSPNIPNSDQERNEGSEGTRTDVKSEEEDTESFVCTEDDCTESFETEHGRNVHEGLKH